MAYGSQRPTESKISYLQLQVCSARHMRFVISTIAKNQLCDYQGQLLYLFSP